jgi:hypothetical protein
MIEVEIFAIENAPLITPDKYAIVRQFEPKLDQKLLGSGALFRVIANKYVLAIFPSDISRRDDLVIVHFSIDLSSSSILLV